MASTDALEAGGASDLSDRALVPGDAEQLAPLSAEVGWNQVAADWRFMLEAGGGKGVVDRAGRIVASALIVPLGFQVSWISMVVIAKPWRGRGIGTRLLKDRIAAIRASGAAAGLDATELGRPLYAALGFRALYELRRWHVKRSPAAVAPPDGVTLRSMRADDLMAVGELDRWLSALDRSHVLRHLFGRAPSLAHVAEAGGKIAGFALGRDGRFAQQIGPVVAADAAIALALAARAAQSVKPPFIMDVPDQQAGMIRWISAAGGEAPRRFWRMTLGDAPGLADARHVFALAGPELA